MKQVLKQLTVAGLMELLKEMPPDALIETGGCDCYGPSGHIEIGENLAKQPTVYIERDE